MRRWFLRDLWLDPGEKAEWQEINDYLIADSFWRRIWQRLRPRKTDR